MWRNISLYAIPFGIAVVAACGGSSKSSDDGGGGGSSSSSGGGSGDAGIACGLRACGASEVCCFSSGQATCVAAGSCMASSLTCSSKASCSSKSCCFTYVGDSGMDFDTACQDSCDSTSYELCDTSADCSNGGMCFPGPFARYCVAFDGGGFMFPDGGFTFPEGGFPFPRRDGSAQPPGDDATAPPGDDASGEDAASE
jgi:hypothetical protein